jgi:ATP-dependent DNA helicase PIF1
MTPNYMPPHELNLKVGCIVMVIATVNFAQGLCNGTRMVITECRRDSIKGDILYGIHRGETAVITRHIFRPQSTSATCNLRRIQLPLRLAYAMTINKVMEKK